MIDTIGTRELLRRSVEAAKDAGDLPGFEAREVLHVLDILSGVINDLTTTGTDGTAVLLVVGALYRMNRGAVVKALGEKRTAQLDGWAEELAKELRKRIPVIVDVIGRDFPDVGG